MKRVYIDSSVVYGAPAKEFAQDSKRFWEAFRNGEFTLVVSDVLEEEIERVPQSVQDRFRLLPKSQIEQVVSTDESDDLAERYVAEGVVDQSNLDDCRHIALATINRADAVVSWNFKHIVYRRAGYNDVNKKLGYPRMLIQPPNQSEVANDEP